VEPPSLVVLHQGARLASMPVPVKMSIAQRSLASLHVHRPATLSPVAHFVVRASCRVPVALPCTNGPVNAPFGIDVLVSLPFVSLLRRHQASPLMASLLQSQSPSRASKAFCENPSETSFHACRNPIVSELSLEYL